MSAEDAVELLAELVRHAGGKITIDPGRNMTHPCTFCAKPAAPTHELMTIGHYPNGDELTRPVCSDCEELGRELEREIK